MLIGIDARFAVHNRRGIGNYTLRLIQNLAEIDKTNEYILYIDKEDVENVLPQECNFKVKRLWPSNYLIWEQIVLPLQAQKDKLDVLHCTGNTAPLYVDKRICLVSSIMDVMYLKGYSILPRSSSMYQRFGRIYRKIVVPRTIKHVSKIITISNFSKNDILRHIPNMEGDKINVIYLAADGRFHYMHNKIEAFNKVKDKFGINSSYILALGGVDPRKNTKFIVENFIELKRERRIVEKLVVVGTPNWRQTNCKEDIIFTDFVSEEDLVLLYNCATVFLYPSLYEGFGIPPLEAMACGVPVITSNITSIPEIAGDAAVQINPQDPEELKASILALLDDEKLRGRLKERGFRQAENFSWKRMAEETLKVYQTCCRKA